MVSKRSSIKLAQFRAASLGELRTIANTTWPKGGQKMNNAQGKQQTNWLLILLLFSQVVLSVFIVMKLSRLEKLILSLNAGSDEPQVPQKVDDVSIDDDPSLGNPNAKVVIVAFGDFECPFCAEATRTEKTILEKYEGKVLFVFRDFPLQNIHPDAFQAAKAANCAGDQGKYWEMHDALFAGQENLKMDGLREKAQGLQLDMTQFDACLKDKKYDLEIQHDTDDALKYEVTGTPEYFVNGNRVGPNQLAFMVDKLVTETSK